MGWSMAVGADGRTVELEDDVAGGEDDGELTGKDEGNDEGKESWVAYSAADALGRSCGE